MTSRLDRYTEVLKDLSRKGRTNGEIRDYLATMGCLVSLETVRKKMKSLKNNGVTNVRGKGRPKKTSKGVLCFLPDQPYRSFDEVRYPFSLRMFLDPEASRREYLELAATELGIAEGENPDPFSNEQIQEWARSLGKNRTESISDLEFCLIAFWCAGIDHIPKGGPELLDFWFRRLIVEAGRIRELMRGAVGLK